MSLLKVRNINTREHKTRCGSKNFIYTEILDTGDNISRLNFCNFILSD